MITIIQTIGWLGVIFCGIIITKNLKKQFIMRQPIIKRNKVSFQNLVKELEKFKPRFGSDVTVNVTVSYWNHSHTTNTTIEYGVCFLAGSSVAFNPKSYSPTDLIYQVEKYLQNEERRFSEIINDVIL
jgi:hypothetical protein